MRFIGIVGLAGVLAACTSVKIVQRDGCWIRRTERKLGGVTEEIGPCMRPEPRWVDDRLTRVVQECVAQADYRWQAKALAAWNRGEPMPAHPEEDALVRDCMSQAGTGAENESLRRRLLEIASDKEQLRTGAAEERERLRASAERLADYLGEAAKRPPGNAFASASSKSDGTASTENSSMQAARGGSGSVPPASAAKPADGPGAAAGTPRASPDTKPRKRPRNAPGVPAAAGTRCDPAGGLTADAAQRSGAPADARCPPVPPAPPAGGAR